jgi:hypothetical protein
LPGTGLVSVAELRLFGVRHHGPGTARALLAGLAAFEPDCVLVEGAPDADSIIPWLAHPALVMPVALLVYRPDDPRRAVFYPFAGFSPEYRALLFALERGIAAGFMDLPRQHTLALTYSATLPPVAPFQALASRIGYENYEAWWNAAIEQTHGGPDIFPAIFDLTAEMRQTVEAEAPPEDESPEDRLARQREAAMRQRIRQAAAAGHRRIAAICGAWHAPALVSALETSGASDEALLADLPSAIVEATWVPWTYGRLAQAGGYGAGIASPGWYDHLWAMGEANLSPSDMSANWLSQVAALLRAEGMDTSPGHVIETVRLAEALAALRGRPFPALPELEEASLSVMCGGNPEPMALIRRRLIVGERMGMVPPDVPAVPLQRDLNAQQARVKLRPEPEKGTLTLDLRQEIDLERSRLLHRLSLLDIAWGVPTRAKGAQPGTYAEVWQLQWLPDLSVKVIEAAMWGNTVRDAAAARLEDIAVRMGDLPELVALVDRAILADLPEGLPAILGRIEELSALSRDVPNLLSALPSLADALRYGGLRQTADHLPILRRVFEHLHTRACLGLPVACRMLDENAASDLIDRLSAAGAAVRLVQSDPALKRWHVALGKLSNQPDIHPIVAGRATRLLFDDDVFDSDGVMERVERALTPGRSAEVSRFAAEWLDGFLRDSGLLLVHDRTLWGAIDRWLLDMDSERFVGILPLLRRTFASYPDGVREQLLSRVRGRWRGQATGDLREARFDPSQAAAVLPVVRQILGLTREETA